VTSPLATVVIVNWNGMHLLPDCLDGLRRQRGDLAFHTWVVDNASTDDSLGLLSDRYPEVRVLRSDRNRGFAGGNNLALREVTTPYAVLLNNDAVPEPEWLERLLAPLREPASEGIGATTGKVLFAPRFVRLRLSTPGFVPGAHDTRELGLRIGSIDVSVAGGPQRSVIGDVLWERLTYGPEGPPDGRFFWTRPTGELLIPVADRGPLEITFGWAAERAKQVVLEGDGLDVPVTLAVDTHPGHSAVKLPAGIPRIDVVNNVGGIVLGEGYGADRGYQQVDEGQYALPEEVFTGCGNGLAMRTELGHRLGWFDEDFFLYYEDTDLSWRLRALGYAIRYEPSAVLRHVHAATSQEWSPTFVFHVDRNRLLMLTKNATAGLAARAAGHYLLTSASIFVRTLRQAVDARNRPPVRPTLLRMRVVASYLRLLPRMLRRRRELNQAATVDRRVLQARWLTAAPPQACPEVALPETGGAAA
jgi:GT2 family glycosyltransferase